MEKNEKKILIYCLCICATMVMLVFWMVNRQQKKIAVVDAVKVFDAFNMKTELEDIAKSQLLTESKQMDSVRNALQLATAVSPDGENSKRLVAAYNNIKSKIESDYSQTNHDINEKVWKRLNPLLDEYGKKNGLHLIIGANGMGSVLYNDAFYDRTNEVVKFVNIRYAEGN